MERWASQGVEAVIPSALGSERCRFRSRTGSRDLGSSASRGRGCRPLQTSLGDKPAAFYLRRICPRRALLIAAECIEPPRTHHRAIRSLVATPRRFRYVAQVRREPDPVIQAWTCYHSQSLVDTCRRRAWESASFFVCSHLHPPTLCSTLLDPPGLTARFLGLG